MKIQQNLRFSKHSSDLGYVDLGDSIFPPTFDTEDDLATHVMV